MEGQIRAEELDSEFISSTVYRQALGSLMYLAVGTRPDISFAVGRLSQFVDKPTRELWVRVKRVLRYLSGTKKEFCVTQVTLLSTQKDIPIPTGVDACKAGSRLQATFS